MEEQIDGDAVVEEKQVNADTALSIGISHGSSAPENLAERPAWASELDFKLFRTGHEYDHEKQQPPNGEQDVEIEEPAQPVVESALRSPGAIKIVREPTQKDISYPATQQEIPAKSTRMWTPTSKQQCSKTKTPCVDKLVNFSFTGNFLVVEENIDCLISTKSILHSTTALSIRKRTFASPTA